MTPYDCAMLCAAAEANYPAKPLWDGVDKRWGAFEQIDGVEAVLTGRKLDLGSQVPMGFYASDPKANEHVVVIRGTETLPEWFENADFLLSQENFCVGLVERGFARMYRGLKMDKQSAMSRLWDLTQGARVTITGHSLGAVLATFLAYDLATNAPHLTVSGVFLASPKPGNSVFAAAFDRAVHDYQTYNYLRDVVPRLPLSLPPVFPYSQLNRQTILKPSDSPDPIPDNVVSNHSCLNYAKLLRGQTP